MAEELAFRRRPDCRPVTYASPISPVLVNKVTTSPVSVGEKGWWRYIDVQEWILAEILLNAAPPELPRQVEHGRKDVGDTQPFGLICDGSGSLLEQVKVEGRGESDGRRPDRPVVREAV